MMMSTCHTKRTLAGGKRIEINVKGATCLSSGHRQPQTLTGDDMRSIAKAPYNRKPPRPAGTGFEPISSILPRALAYLTHHRRRAERWTRGPFTLAKSYRLDRLLEAERILRNVIEDEEKRHG